MGVLNRGFYTKDIFCKQKRSETLTLASLGRQCTARSPRQVRAKVHEEDAKTIGCEVDAMRPLGGCRKQQDDLGPATLVSDVGAALRFPTHLYRRCSMQDTSG